MQPEEHVSVMVHLPHKVPAGAEQTDLARRLKERVDKTVSNLKDVPEAELDELIDEAVDPVRHLRS